MAPISLSDLIATLPSDETWGPPTTTETLVEGVPYAPYSKGDKLGRMADWTDGKDRDGRSGRQQYRNNYRDQQTYGAGSSSLFTVQLAEDENSFSVVDNTRTSTKTRGFGRGGGMVLRGRGGRGGAQTQQRGGRGGTFTRVGGRGGQQGQDSRGGRGRGGRRGGWKDYDKPQRNRDSSINIKPDWHVLEEIDFNRLSKLSLDGGKGTDLDSYGFLHYYDRSYDRPPLKGAEQKLNIMERAVYNVSTSADPVIQELAEQDSATVFATDNILSMLMCCTRSVYSWDIIVTRQGSKIFFDKRDGSAIDMVSVNENAADAPLDGSEGSKDSVNFPSALAEEATFINHNFATQVVTESQSAKVTFPHENPFYNAAEETEAAASKAYKYKKFDLATSTDDEPLHLIVRTEIDAMLKHPTTGQDQLATLKALNEFDNKAQGAGGALDWRSKLTSARGAVLTTEMKNNNCKLARWVTQAMLAGAEQMKLGFVSRANPKVNDRHIILGVMGFDPKKFADQMSYNINNGWGIVRSIVDICMKLGDGKFVLVKDPNKPLLRLYEVPGDAFDEEDEDGEGQAAEGEDGDD